jgi:gliding motility-associated-like protein
MLTKVKILLMAVLATYCNWLTAQSLSNKGKEFWVGYGHHQFMESGNGNGQEMVLYFSAEQRAHVTVTINGLPYKEEYDIPGNSVIVSKTMPKGLEAFPASVYDCRLYTKAPSFPGGTGSEGVFKKHGIHIESDVPIVAYAHIYGDLASGASMLMPVETWGYSYVALNTRQYYQGKFDCFSWLYIVAQTNNTKVRITPSVATRNGMPANIPFEVALQKGEIYQLVGAPINAEEGQDLTGTTIVSISDNGDDCHPVAVFTGSSRTSVSCNGSVGSGDNILQQIFPYQAWGKQYLTAPTSSTEGGGSKLNMNVYRIVVKDRATIVKKNGQRLYGLNGFYYEYQSNTADYIETDQPVLVAQYIPSQGACDYTGSGDPEMMYISPLEQAIKRVGFFRNSEEKIDWNYLTLIIPDAGLASLSIDGSTTFSYTYKHPNKAGYTVVIRRWKAAKAQCIVQSDSAFTAITYGLGSAESYGYNAGTLINNLNGLPAIKNQYGTTPTNEYTCVNTPVELSVLMRYKPTQMEWRLAELAGIITPATNVLVNDPVPVSIEKLNGIDYYKYSLPGFYTFNRTGKHQVPLYATSPQVENCNNTELVKYEVEVKPGYSTDFNIVYNNCNLSETIFFEGKDIFNTKDSIKNWQWTFSNNTTAAGKTVSQLFSAGHYTARFFAIDSVGCVADTTKSFDLVSKPATPTFTSNAVNICEGVVTAFKNTTATAGIKQWYWDFGNNDTFTSQDDGAVNASFAQYGSVQVKHVVRFSETCVSDTAVQTIVVYAKPAVSIQNPSGCMPSGGQVQFTNSNTVADGQAISQYKWRFGDANASVANPDSSTVANPSHIYSSAATYNVSLQITTEKGCVADSAIQLKLLPSPKLSFAPLAAVCINGAAVSVANASITNGLTGTGLYKGMATTTDGIFTPSQATVGTAEIGYVFTTADGCSDSAMRSITVHPAPTASFVASSKICAGANALYEPTSTNAGITKWSWNFGDGNEATYTTAAAFNHLYNSAGTYLAKLSVTDANNCVSDTATQNIEAEGLPKTSFSLPTVVCMPGTAVFTNTTPGSGLIYTWHFGDGSISNETNPAHEYAAAGNYQVILQASSGIGCKAGDTAIMSNFQQKPVADFALSDTGICQGKSVFFTNKSVAAGSIINSWHWEFGDGTAAGTEQANKTFDQPGTYAVQLKVTNADGCISDAVSYPIRVYPQPAIDAGKPVVAKAGTVVQLNGTANSTNLKLEWAPAQNISNPYTLDPTLLVTADQIYTLTAIGENNCTASSQLQVIVQKEVEIPNAFSPNGDGINDAWLVRNIGQYSQSVIQVYDRYGSRVFNGVGTSKPWDGSSNGKPLPVGVYYYLIKLYNGSAAITGSVTLIR